MTKIGDPTLRLPGLRVLRDLFRGLDADMVETFRYVEPVEENLGAYSIEFMRLLQSSCTGIDSTFRLWYRLMIHEKVEVPDVDVDRLGFGGYFPLLELLGVEPTDTLELPRNPSLLIAPFGEWRGKESIPAWWTAHNKTKHELDRITFKGATMGNALHGLGGFYLALNDMGTISTHPVGTSVFKPLF